MNDSAPATRAVSYRDRKNAVPDHVIFFTFVVIGSLVIILAKEHGFSGSIYTGVPVVLMLVYAAIAWGSKRFRLREDRVGDNLYYLGFLYTLVSLAHALVQFNMGASDVELIISNFGIALATTIVGLMLRVLFNQMREDPVEYEREARSELNEASRKLRTELDSVFVELSSFRRALTQSLGEGIKEIADNANATLDSSAGKYRELTQQALEGINAAFATFTDQSKKLNKVASGTVGAIQSLLNRIEKIDASPDMISTLLKPLVDRSSILIESARDQSELQQKYTAAVTAASDAAVASVRDLAEGLRGVDQALGNGSVHLLEAFRNTDENLRALLQASKDLNAQTANGLEHVRSVSAGVLDELQGDLGAIKRTRSELESELSRSRDTLAQVYKALSSLATFVIEKTDGR